MKRLVRLSPLKEERRHGLTSKEKESGWKRLKKVEEALDSSNGSSSGTLTTGNMSIDEQQIVVATINSVMAVSRYNTNGGIQFPTNGRSVRFIQGVRSGISVSLDITFDHLGNPL